MQGRLGLGRRAQPAGVQDGTKQTCAAGAAAAECCCNAVQSGWEQVSHLCVLRALYGIDDGQQRSPRKRVQCGDAHRQQPAPAPG